MKQKIVMKVQFTSQKRRTDAFKIAAATSGVSSVSIEADKDHIVVIGEDVDSVCLATALRKKLGHVEIESVEEVKKEEEKKEEKIESIPIQYWTSNYAHYPMQYNDYIYLWHLSVKKNKVLFVKLYPEISNLIRENLPIASFVIRVVCSVGDRKALTHPEITDKQLKTNEDFVWGIEVPLMGKFIIDVEFLDLKTYPRDGGQPSSIWAEGRTQKRSHATALASLSRMLREGLHADIKINASDGSIGAHRAILAARSPVFQSMFSHDLQEKERSTIDICDMSIDACQAFLNYIYGNIGQEEFLTHRLALLHAADKYDICDLKEACHESLLEDIDATNVLDRLQNASLYELPRLKTSCMRYLVKFGKIYDIRDDFNAFLIRAVRELIAEIFHEVLNAWKGF